MTSIPVEPYFFNPIFKEKIWGGNSLSKKLGKELPVNTLIGESWELCGFGNVQSTIINGVLADKTLGALFNQYRAELANGLQTTDFPILLKFLDSHQKLSVQIHPTSQFAQKKGLGEKGKDECWYIVDAAENARLILGFKNDVSRDDVRKAVWSNTLEELLNVVPVKTGDVYYIPAGTLHAILEGVLIYEIQEPSDCTLRLYDWGRVDSFGKSRELHIEHSLEIVDVVARNYKIQPVELLYKDYTHSFRVATRYFSIEEFKFHTRTLIELQAKKYFRILTALNCPVRVHFENGVTDIAIGQTALIPSICKDIAIQADRGAIVLCSTFPDLEIDIIKPLLKKDITPAEIRNLAGSWANNDIDTSLAVLTL